MSHEDGSSKPTEADPVTDDENQLRDTQPGVPANMELSRTLPTGAAFHMTWRQPQIVLPNTPGATDSPVSPRQIMSGESAAGSSVSGAEPSPLASAEVPSAMSNTPATLPKTSTTQTPVPPAPGAPLPRGSATRKEFGGPAKLSPREKARRNMLTHTLQMPIAIRPVQVSMQPMAAEPRAMEARRHGTVPPSSQSTIVEGTPAVKPGPGWTSVQRIGGAPSSAEAAGGNRSQRSTDPMVSTIVGGTGSGAPQPTGVHSARNGQEVPSWQQLAANPGPGAGVHEPERWVTRLQPGDYDRTTVPDASPIRIPALNAREWMFIGLLACASAATLYSLFVDDIASSVEEDTQAATMTEHVVTPAEPAPTPTGNADKAPAPAPAPPVQAQPPAANAAAGTTEIITDPPHAEVVVGGAVIGNTPAQVVRGDKDADYLLRKPGYEPQLVRVTPHSGKSISITLRPKPAQN